MTMIARSLSYYVHSLLNRNVKLVIIFTFVALHLVLLTPPASAATIVVPAGGDLQAALNAAQFGDTIILQAGATWTAPGGFQPYILPAKSGGTGTDADYITVRTSAIDSLPSGRVSPSDKGNMAKILAVGPLGAISAASGAKYWKLVGLELTNQSNGSQAQHCNSLVDLGANANPAMSGDKITFDRCYVHSQEDGTTNYYRTASRAFFANSGDLTISNSYLSGFAGFYAHNPTEIIDAEAFASVAGGPYTLDNNFMQADYNPLFLGGGDPGVPPSHTATVAPGASLTQAVLSSVTDLQVGDKIALEVGATGGDQFACGTVTGISGTTITYTTLVRNEGGEAYVVSSRAPQSGGQARWRGYTLSNVRITRNTIDTDLAAATFVFNRSGSKPKAYAEIKLLENSLWEGNIFQGWPTGIAITLRNQNGYSPWSNVKDVTFRNNLFKDFSVVLICQLFSGDRLSETGSNIQLVNNLAYGGISYSLVSTFPSVILSTGPGAGTPILVQHNTIINRQSVPGGSLMAGTNQMSGVVMKDNIMYFNNYGATCGQPPNTFAQCWPNFTETKDAIVDNASVGSNWITGANGNFRNAFYVGSEAAIGFTNVAANDYRLLPGSPYRNAASDGTDVGVNMDQLLAALGGAIPPPTPTPTPTVTPTPTPTPTPTGTPTPTPTPTPTGTPTPTPSPTATPTPTPGSVPVIGYVKVNGVYFSQPATVSLVSGGQTRTLTTAPGGFFNFGTGNSGDVLQTTSPGYSFSSVTVNGSPYYIIDGMAGQPTPTNPIDDAQTFVRWHYLDFLSREPDPGGWGYWAQQILNCGGDAACTQAQRISVSAAFFIEQEFQDTGDFVYRFYKSSLGRRPTVAEFTPDHSLIVAGANLEAQKQAFADAWVQRTGFIQRYPANLSGSQFIDRLIQNVQQSSGVNLISQRPALIADWNSFGSRARIVRAVADSSAFEAAERNGSFVLMQYFGYLHRDPDQAGYDFWLNVLNNQDPNNYRGMVCAFITSAEYQLRFGQNVTHSNSMCGP